MIYTIHIRPESLGDERWVTPRAVPESKASWALFFPPLWLAWHSLFFELVIYAMISLAVLGLLFTPYALAAVALAGLPTLYLFLEGNQLRRNALARRGYEMVDLVDAPDEEMALARYFDSEEAQADPGSAMVFDRRRAAPPVKDDDLSFGLFGGAGV